MNYKIIVPVLNESRFIKKFIDTFPEKHIKHLILVDDGSSDDTAKIIKTDYPHIQLLKHKINLGKGKSMETGALKAIKDKADILIFMDGDLQHKATDINRFIRAFSKHPEVDILFGTRSIGRTMRLVPFIGNKFLTIGINILFKYFLNDTQCGFRAFRSRVFNKLRWKSHGYSVETEMIINAAKNRLKYKEIPIETIYLDHYKGTSVIDGIIILLKILAWKLWK